MIVANNFADCGSGSGSGSGIVANNYKYWSGEQVANNYRLEIKD